MSNTERRVTFHELERFLQDPVFVHRNMLRGTIAKPSVAQIIHVYGEDAIRAGLGASSPYQDVKE